MNAVVQPDLTLESFEAGSFDVDAFDHGAHVYIGWLYLERYSLLESIGRYTDALKRLTTNLGIPGKYHETISWFFLVLIEERRAMADSSGWQVFRTENRDLFDAAGATLDRYYSKELLASPSARTSFCLPDKLTASA